MLPYGKKIWIWTQDPCTSIIVGPSTRFWLYRYLKWNFLKFQQLKRIFTPETNKNHSSIMLPRLHSYHLVGNNK